ncbi:MULTISPECIES: XdhC family protein [Paenibacillus]|uniref:XdhC family protein n=1 Tax=Paenibacillus TaxID=44249 RepID=UPI00073F80FE|nr:MULTISPECIES: XdhC/CoxI family protein [Paenibacillus]MDU4695142.1 XdhC family protein [Paenibacillus sp.]
MSMYEICAFVANDDGPAVLATLIAAEGHSYRKPGAAMLFYPSGTLGSLSPGCLESDLSLQAEAVWETARTASVEYDMRTPDDVGWGEAVGCGGRITVVLEPVIGELRDLLRQAKRRMDAGQSLVLRRIRQARGYTYAYRLEEGEWLQQKTEGELFATPLVPMPRLVLFGAGSDSGAIAELAARAGFRIAVADWREARLQGGFSAQESVLCPPGEAPRQLDISNRDYVLICSHSFLRDRDFLEQVLPRQPRYLGIVGSKTRIARLTEALEWPEGLSLHAPAGLAIGGEGPEEIAVSIVAELIREKRAVIRSPWHEGGFYDEGLRDLSGSGERQSNGRLQNLA